MRGGSITFLIMDYSKIDNVEVGGVDINDYPDFSNAFIISADYNGEAMTEEQLDQINDDSGFVHECVLNSVNQ